VHNQRTAKKRRHAAESRQRIWQGGFLAVAVAASLALFGWTAFGAQSGTNAPHLLLGVPAYVYPGQPALVTLQGLKPPPGIVILNPGNGDAPFGASWQAQAGRLRAQGITVLGYVHTDAATRPLADAEASIRNYLRPATGSNRVSGIFLDEMSNGCTALPYYAQLAAYIRGLAPSAFIAANPGTAVAVCFLQARPKPANTYVTFEHDATTYQTSFAGNVLNPGGTFSMGLQYPAATFWHLVYSATSAQLSSIMSLARSRNAGYVYATDGSLPNPWDSVASYLPAEARAAEATPPRHLIRRGNS
jgi:hypothetical protein